MSQSHVLRLLRLLHRPLLHFDVVYRLLNVSAYIANPSLQFLHHDQALVLFWTVETFIHSCGRMILFGSVFALIVEDIQPRFEAKQDSLRRGISLSHGVWRKTVRGIEGDVCGGGGSG